MRIRSIFFLLITLFGFQAKAGIELVQNGKTRYRIVIPSDATTEERQAATDLQHYLGKISGAEFPIIKESEKQTDFEIIIGSQMHSKQLNANSLFNKPRWSAVGIANKAKQDMKRDGFYLYTHGNTLVIYGGKDKGVQYAVYELLEKYLGYRMYTPDAMVIPQSRQITLPDIDTKQEPYFDWRETSNRNGMVTSEFTNWNRLQTRSERQKQWGMFVHTFSQLVPEKIYFDTHPEWFSEINGKRVRDGQLCLTNEEVYKKLLTSLRIKIAEHPDMLYWSVSNNDNYNNCECANCKAMDDKYQSPSGTLITFINRIAAEFPDKTISTLAYQYTRKAPVGIKPAKNVNIMFCSIECDRSMPVSQNPQEKEFCQDMKNWADFTDNIFMWDYVVQFRNYMDPFPNLHVLAGNLQFFAQNHCALMFEQGSGNSVTEFCELRTYMLAKLMWNPYCNVDSLMNDFLNGYYGAAGKYIRQYIDTMRVNLLASGKFLNIYGYPIDAKDSYLKPHLLKTYMQIFQQAFEAVAYNPELTHRVKLASMPLEFAIVDMSMHDLTPEFSYFRENSDKKQIANESMVNRLNTFVDNCKTFNINSLEEFPYPPQKYKENVLHFVERGLQPNLAYRKPVILLTTFSTLYDAGGEKALTDGRFGVLDYHYNWLGFQGQHLEAIVDLQEEKAISQVNIDFLEMPLSWIFQPKQVEFYASEDGSSWTLLKTESSPPNTESLNKSFIHNYTVKFTKQNYRYVKIKGISNLTCPEWHRGWGQPSWIFADEIVVN